MMGPTGLRPIASIALRFVLAMALLLPLWWWFVPTYGWLLVQGCGTLLRTAFGMPITAGDIKVAGIMNTDSLLIFYLHEQPTSMKFVQLVTNLPPFIALIMASPGLSFRRRCGAIALGSGILIGTHALFILAALRFAASLQAAPAIPTAIAQFFLTLPFLLWIVLAYWRPQDASDTPQDEDVTG